LTILPHKTKLYFIHQNSFKRTSALDPLPGRSFPANTLHINNCPLFVLGLTAASRLIGNYPLTTVSYKREIAHNQRAIDDCPFTVARCQRAVINRQSSMGNEQRATISLRREDEGIKYSLPL
jgi:hypothetical protein